MPVSFELLADRYQSFLDEVKVSELSDRAACQQSSLPHEQVLQMQLSDGAFGFEFIDLEERCVVIHRLGRWNRGAGPDFQDSLVEIDGKLVEGDIELDKCPEDWERHGHGGNADFDRVVLHLVCSEPHQAWFTRNSRHEHISCAVIPEDVLRGELVDSGKSDISSHDPGCGDMFASLDDECVAVFLKAVAAYRLRKKQQVWRRKAALFGEDQALYECLAETLGYSANKASMRHLAKRASLADIASHPEAILYGTAGFLKPVLEESCDEQTRQYHKDLWQYWWRHRECFELSSGRGFSWVSSSLRPANHPQRRLAALAVIVSRWNEFKSLCRLSSHRPLVQWMTELTHPYWDRHVTLPSPLMEKPMALVGKDRTMDFIINHVAALDGSAEAWDRYLELPGGSLNRKVEETSVHLLGRERSKRLIRKAYQHQALIQVYDDFCAKGCSRTCLLPSQAPAWVERDHQS